MGYKSLYKRVIAFLCVRLLDSKPKGSDSLKNVDPKFLDILDENPDLFDSSTRLSPKLYTTYCATKYIVENNLDGDFVECGVYKGKMVAMMALTLLKFGSKNYKIYLFDTFCGMTGASEFDFKDHRPGYTSEYNKKRQKEMQRGDVNLRCFSPKDEVINYISKTKYPSHLFHLIEGDVLKTLPAQKIEKISFLRLDTDWYESTKHELECLYPLLVKGGVFSQDDYGSWAGARKAVNEFFATKKKKPILFRVGESEVVTLKLD